MNKRQKKKREKKILLWELEQKAPKIERYGLDFNHEGYKDSTAAAAIRNVLKEEKNVSKNINNRAGVQRGTISR